MVKLLYIESSPRKKRSASIEVAHTFLQEYKRKHADDTIQTIDLWSKNLPAFDGEVIDAKYQILSRHSFSEAEKRAWKPVEDIIAEFKDADKYLFSLPMWNFSIPYKLKHYIDLLVQPGYTFTMTPEGGFKGLIDNKPVLLIYARGGAYPAGTPGEAFDLQKRYMETILGFIGFKDFKSIIIESTGNPDSKNAALEKAKREALEQAAQF